MTACLQVRFLKKFLLNLSLHDGINGCLCHTDLPEAEAAELENKLKVLNTIDQEVGIESF